MKIIPDEVNKFSHKFVFDEEEQQYYDSFDKDTQYRVKGFLLYRMIYDKWNSKIRLLPLEHCLAKFLIKDLLNNNTIIEGKNSVYDRSARGIYNKKINKHIKDKALSYKGDIQAIRGSFYSYILERKRNIHRKRNYVLRKYKYDLSVILKLRPTIIRYTMNLTRFGKGARYYINVYLTPLGEKLAWFINREEL